MDNYVYERMVKNSTTGSRTKAKPQKTVRVKVEDVKKALIGICATCVVFGAIAISGLKTMTNMIGDYFDVFHVTNQFYEEAIYENTHRTDDMQHYWYNYHKIAEHVKTDEDVYLLYRNLGETQSNKVLQCLEQQTTIEDFVKNHNYESIQDWKDTEFKKICLQKDIAEHQSQLDEMTSEYKASNQQISAVNELGGK